MAVLAGLALRTDEFFTAFRKVYFNAFVQVFNYGVVSSIVFGFSRLMIEMGAISKVLGDGIAISGCLPITVNMCIVLTKAAGGGKSLTQGPHSIMLTITGEELSHVSLSTLVPQTKP